MISKINTAQQSKHSHASIRNTITHYHLCKSSCAFFYKPLCENLFTLHIYMYILRSYAYTRTHCTYISTCVQTSLFKFRAKNRNQQMEGLCGIFLDEFAIFACKRKIYGKMDRFRKKGNMSVHYIGGR